MTNTSLQRATNSRPYMPGDYTGLSRSRRAAEEAKREQEQADREALIDQLPEVINAQAAAIRELRERVTFLETHAHNHPEDESSADD